MKIGKSGLFLWGLYAAFACVAAYSSWQPGTLDFSVPLGGFKALVWLALLAFLAYSFLSTLRENFFRSVRSVLSLYWGRQITIDLYLGILIGLLLIVLNEGLVVALLWLLPLLIYANLAMLLYVALHFDAIVSHFSVVT